MKKEILKGFSLLALIIVFALMTAIASTNAPLTTVEANSPSQSVVNGATASNAKRSQY